MPFKDYTIREMFKQLLRAFTKQNVDVLLDTDDLFVYDEHTHIWQRNNQHPLFQITHFSILIIPLVNEFLSLPRCQNIHPVKKHGRITPVVPRLSPSDISTVIDAVDFALDREIEKYLPDLTLEPITALTGEKYESDDVGGMCAVFSVQPLDYGAFLSGFYQVDVGNKKKLDFNSIHAHRKFLNLSSRGKRREQNLDSALEAPHPQQCLVYERTKKRDQISYELVGFAERKSALAQLPGVIFFSNSQWGFSLPFKKSGVDGSFPEAESKCVAVLRDGHFCLPEYPREDFKLLEYKWLQLHLPSKNTSIQDTAYNVLQVAENQKKGALIIISEDRVMHEIAKNVCLYQMGIRISDETQLNLADQNEYLYSFSFIDGAVLLDFNGRCYAIGAILGGEPTATAQSPCMEVGDIGRGSRYNSARKFLDRAADRYRGVLFLAIVVSEDGIVDLLRAKHD